MQIAAGGGPYRADNSFYQHLLLLMAAPMRLARQIAQSGVASRREAERWIKSGKVMLDGRIVSSPATSVVGGEVIKVNGLQPVVACSSCTPKLWAVHKPVRSLVTRNDGELGNRPCLMQQIRKVGLSDALKPVGRLDYMTEGLMLITNDGELARLLEHPRTAIGRVYHVRVHGRVTEEKLRAMRAGLLFNGTKYRGMAVEQTQTHLRRHDCGTNSWLKITCTEGKNNQIRKVMKSLNLTVNRLIRVAYGPWKLGKLRSLGVAKLSVKEDYVKKLRKRFEKGGNSAAIAPSGRLPPPR